MRRMTRVGWRRRTCYGVIARRDGAGWANSLGTDFCAVRARKDHTFEHFSRYDVRPFYKCRNPANSRVSWTVSKRGGRIGWRTAYNNRPESAMGRASDFSMANTSDPGLPFRRLPSGG